MPGRSLGSRGWHWKPDTGSESHWQITPGPVTVTVAAPGAGPRGPSHSGATAIAPEGRYDPGPPGGGSQPHPEIPAAGASGRTLPIPSKSTRVCHRDAGQLEYGDMRGPGQLELEVARVSEPIVTLRISVLTVSPHPGKRSLAAGMHRGGEHSIRRPVPVAERACPWKKSERGSMYDSAVATQIILEAKKIAHAGVFSIVHPGLQLAPRPPQARRPSA